MNPKDALSAARVTGLPVPERVSLFRSVFDHPKAKKLERAEAGASGLLLELAQVAGPVPDEMVARALETLRLIPKKDPSSAWRLASPFADRYGEHGQRDAGVDLFLAYLGFEKVKVAWASRAIYMVPRFLDDPRVQEKICPSAPKWVDPQKLAATVVARRRIGSPYSSSLQPRSPKLGGTPALASAADWPRDAAGRPLHFVAQIPEFHAIGPAWPALGAGHYQFFVSDEAVSRLRGPVCVRFEPTGRETVDLEGVRAEIHDAFGRHAVASPSCYHDHIDVQAMSGFDYRFEALLGGSRAQRTALDRKAFNVPPLHQIGGYPYFTQGEDQRRLTDEPQADVLMLQLDSDSRYGMSWGDSGIVQFFIPAGDLLRGDFSRVRFLGDCL